jgi:hypothetical protein
MCFKYSKNILEYFLYLIWTTKWSEFESRWGKNFYFSMSSRPARGSTQSPIQWVKRAVSQG